MTSHAPWERFTRFHFVPPADLELSLNLFLQVVQVQKVAVRKQQLKDLMCFLLSTSRTLSSHRPRSHD